MCFRYHLHLSQIHLAPIVHDITFPTEVHHNNTQMKHIRQNGSYSCRRIVNISYFFYSVDVKIQSFFCNNVYNV